MAVIERTVLRKGSLQSLILGRVLPHTVIVAYLLYFLTGRIGTLAENLWLGVACYSVFTFLHSYAAYRRVRYGYVFSASVLLAIALWAAVQLTTMPTEAGVFYAQFLASFYILLLLFSAANNYWFLASRFTYLAELVLFNAVWLVIIVTGIEVPIQDAIALSLPLVAYSMYVLLFDYAFLQPLHAGDKGRLFMKYAAVILILIVATVFGFLSGISKSEEEITRTYSLMSSQGGLYMMDDRAKMEEDFRIPLDSKELIFAAQIDPVPLFGRNENVGYYLKFHSLYNYDPVSAEFNTKSDEMEDPYFYIRQVDITTETGTPRNLAVDLAGNSIVPPYLLRAPGAATIYNVKLDTKQSFANNITHRFVAYPGGDSIAIGEETYPILGVYRLFNRISFLNIIPAGTSGQFFEFDYNAAVLMQAERFYAPDAVPPGFAQPYLNYSGLEQDIVDTMKAMLKGRTTLTDRVQAVFEFFTQKDAAGNPVFVYDIHPGKSPDPGETMLHYFLMKNRLGYCTYYATAATLFFRVAGIPARVAIGFVPGETSSQNPGWYYVYSQQGHAWTEIYLGPNIGWLDVDLTPAVGSDEAGPAPPNPSPPRPPIPPDPVFALRAVTVATEPLMVEPVRLQKRTEREDIPLCDAFAVPAVRCEFDSGYGNRERAASVLSTVEPGDTLLLTGREEKNPGADTCAFEVFSWYTVRRIELKQRDSLATAQNGTAAKGWGIPLWAWLVALGALIVLIHSTPTIHLWRLRRKAVKSPDGGVRLTAMRDWLVMMFHLYGYPSGRETDMEYAFRLVEKPGAEVRVFFAAYIQYRYYGMAVPAADELVEEATEETVRALRESTNIARRFWARIHLWEYFRVLSKWKAK